MKVVALLRRHVLVLTLLLVPTAPLWAQVDAERTPGIYQRFAHPGEATIPVIVMGLGGNGLFEIGESVDLDELVVLAGGAGLNPEQDRVRMTVYRQSGGQRVEIYQANMQDMLVDQAAYPTLEAGDLLLIESRPRRRLDWRDVFRIVSAVSSTTFLVMRLVDVF